MSLQGTRYILFEFIFPGGQCEFKLSWWPDVQNITFSYCKKQILYISRLAWRALLVSRDSCSLRTGFMTFLRTKKRHDGSKATVQPLIQVSHSIAIICSINLFAYPWRPPPWWPIPWPPTIKISFIFPHGSATSDLFNYFNILQAEMAIFFYLFYTSSPSFLGKRIQQIFYSLQQHQLTLIKVS